MKKCLNRILVVEGKEDASYLSNYFSSEIVVVNGFELSTKTVNYLKDKPVILFLDPDESGKKIRSKLSKILNNAVNVEIDIAKCTRGVKTGVAECEIDEIQTKLAPYVCQKSVSQTDLSIADLYNLNLFKDKELRELVAERLNLGKCNGKTFYRRLVANNIDSDKLKEIIKDIKHGN